MAYSQLNLVSAYFQPTSGFANILMYHSVGDNKAFFTVRPEDFEWQMDYLQRNKYIVLGLEETLNMLFEKNKFPPHSVVLTFDDGYKDTYTIAFPILKKYGYKTTIFVITDLIGKEMLNRNYISLPMLDWPEIKEMHASGLIDFQPHSASHPDFEKTPLDILEQEIVRSKNTLETNLHKECKLFAYPRGKYTPEVIELLKKHGFKGAVTVNEGIVKLGDDSFQLKRNSIDSSVGEAQFKGKISYSIELFRRVFKSNDKYKTHRP